MTTAKLILLGLLQVTSYRPLAKQTTPQCVDRFHCETPDGNNFSELGVAVSRDLLATGKVRYGDALYIEGFGWHIVSDTMGARSTRAIDLPVYSYAEEKQVGVRHLHVYRAEVINGR